jgi:hypothetical protein
MWCLPSSTENTPALTHNKVETAAAWGIVVVVGVTTYFQLRHQPFYEDAHAYAQAARSLTHKGVLGSWYRSDLRTYGYPLFLAGAYRLAGLIHVGDTTSVFKLQWTAHVGSAWLAATTLVRGRISLLVFLAVAANPLLIV